LILKARCQRCRQVFAFQAHEVPVQRAGVKGSPRWARVVAYYPSCPRCRETVEVANSPLVELPNGKAEHPAM